MTNNTNTQLKAYLVENSSPNDMNSSVKAQNSSLYATNSSFNGKVINIANKINKIVKNLSIFGAKKTDVTGAVTHLLHFSGSEKQGFTSDDNKRYYTPTTNCSAAKPSRHSSAIFMPKICLTNYQRFTNGINTNTSALQSRHKYSADSVGTNTYDGSSEPNKIPLVGNKLRRLNTVVNGLSPSFFAGDNKLTNCSGAILNG